MKLTTCLLLALVFVVGFASSAHAYLDPGTGSIILQGLIATIAAGLATSRLWWYRLKERIGKIMHGGNSEKSDTDSE